MGRKQFLTLIFSGLLCGAFPAHADVCMAWWVVEIQLEQDSELAGAEDPKAQLKGEVGGPDSALAARSYRMRDATPVDQCDSSSLNIKELARITAPNERVVDSGCECFTRLK